MKEQALDQSGGQTPSVLLGTRYRFVRPWLHRPSSVFLVEDPAEGGRRRLIQAIPDRSDTRAAADRARRVTHENIAVLHRVEPGDDALLLVCDVCEGETLADRLRRLGPLHEDLVVRIMRRVARGIDQAHAMGVVHGGLSPELVVLDGSDSVAVTGLAVEAAIRGTDRSQAQWLAPEVVDGQAGSVASDVYAFAAVIFAMLNGRGPLLRGDQAHESGMRSAPDALEESPLRRALRTVALQGLDREPFRRPGSCGELMDRIESVVVAGEKAESRRHEESEAEPVRLDYATPMDLLDLESRVADIAPLRTRLVLGDHPSIKAHWEKGEHFLSSGAVYKQLQQWQATGESLRRSYIEFRSTLALDRGLVESRERRSVLAERLASARWVDHPASSQLRDQVRALIEGDRCVWSNAFAEGRLEDADASLERAATALNSAAFLNREIASALEWRRRWRNLADRIPNRTMDHVSAAEVRDHLDAVQQADELHESGAFAIAGGILATRLDRLEIVLDRESAAWERAVAARKRFDEAMGRVPSVRPVSKALRESLEALLEESDRIDDACFAVGRFDEAGQRWSAAAASIGGHVQQDVERYGRMETARENYRVAIAEGPKRDTWTRLREEFAAITEVAKSAAKSRDDGDFEDAERGWIDARRRFGQALAADGERHRAALLAKERFGRRLEALPQRALDRSVRADVQRLQQRRGVLEDWMVCGRFSEIEDAVERAIVAIDRALEVDARLHTAALAARDRTAMIAIEYPSHVAQEVLDAVGPLFTDVDGSALQARQAYDLGEYADCAEAWDRTAALRRRVSEELREETRRFERKRRRRTLLRLAGTAAVFLLLLAIGGELGSRAWIGDQRTQAAGLSLDPGSPALRQRQDELVAGHDAVLQGPSVMLKLLVAGPSLASELDELRLLTQSATLLEDSVRAISVLDADPDLPYPIRQDVSEFNRSVDAVRTQWRVAEFEGLQERLDTLSEQRSRLEDRIESAQAVLDRIRTAEIAGEASVALPTAPVGGAATVGELLALARDRYENEEWSDVDDILARANSAYSAIDDATRRQAAEAARARFQKLWFADEARSYRTIVGGSDRNRIETAADDAGRAFREGDFVEAEAAWDRAIEAAERAIELARPRLVDFESRKAEWEGRRRPPEFVRSLPGYDSRFSSVEEAALEAQRVGIDGSPEDGARRFGNALTRWDRILEDFDQDRSERMEKLGDETVDAVRRFNDADWLLKVLPAESPEHARVRMERDRLVWLVRQPKPGERRLWPLDESRGIEFVYCESSDRFDVAAVDTSIAPGAMRVDLSGFWVSGKPLQGDVTRRGMVDDEGFDLITWAEAEAFADSIGSIKVATSATGLLDEASGLRSRTFWCRLPTEAEWIRAAGDGVLAEQRGAGEWCGDRFVEDSWWKHLVRQDPGGPFDGRGHVVREHAKARRAGDEGDRAAVRLVLSPVRAPAPIEADELGDRTDPRLLGGRDERRPTRRVIIEGVEVEFVLLPVAPGGKDLWVAVTETTQALWKAVMGGLPGDQAFEDPDAPVANMTLYEARNFCKKIRGRSRRTDVRLPTPEVWTRAAMAEWEDPYCFGSRERLKRIDDFAWYVDNAVAVPRPVGILKPSWWWLHDIHGNVEEWTDSGEEAPVRVPVFGGHFASSADDCGIDRSHMVEPMFGSKVRGFRMVADELPAD